MIWGSQYSNLRLCAVDGRGHSRSQRYQSRRSAILLHRGSPSLPSCVIFESALLCVRSCDYLRCCALTFQDNRTKRVLG